MQKICSGDSLPFRERIIIIGLFVEENLRNFDGIPGFPWAQFESHCSIFLHFCGLDAILLLHSDHMKLPYTKSNYLPIKVNAVSSDWQRFSRVLS